MRLKVLKFKSVDSTNNKAIKLIKSNKLKPTIIISTLQKNGRGRYGRKWISIKGNLFLSIYFKIKDHSSLKFLTKKNCNLVKKSLSKFINKRILVKYPNDLLIENKKVCGILQETIIYKKYKFLIIGIGVNLIKSPNISNYPTTYLFKFIKKKIGINLVYNVIKKNFEKSF
tara:strand:+ start:143 stop:655 length:513 start_codon:yes stop_codon:yes gene_type:complete